MTIRVLVVDDQAVVRMGFRAVLDAADGIEVVGEAADGAAAVDVATRLRPDVVLMDVRMPGTGGIAATRRVTALEDPRVRVLVVTTFDLDEYVFDSLRAGASGFLLKDIDPEEMVAAVRTVHAGDALLAPSVTGRLIAEFVRSPPPAETPPDSSLTGRERDVVVLVARGLSNGEIARALHLAESTVKTHISHVLTKWDLRDRVQLVVRAFETGLVPARPDPTP
ncbi:MAG: response regulator [Pseudonocardiaceae bacterium]